MEKPTKNLTSFKQNLRSKSYWSDQTSRIIATSSSCFASRDLEQLCCFTDSHLLRFSRPHFTWRQQPSWWVMGIFNSILWDPQTLRADTTEPWRIFYFFFPDWRGIFRWPANRTKTMKKRNLGIIRLKLHYVRCNWLLLLGGFCWNTPSIRGTFVHRNVEKIQGSF